MKLYFTWVYLLLIQAYLYSEKKKQYEAKLSDCRSKEEVSGE